MKTHIRSSSTSNVISPCSKIENLFSSHPSRKKAMQLYLQQYIHPEPISKNQTNRKKRNLSVQLSYLPYLKWEKQTTKTHQNNNLKPALNFRSRVFHSPIKTSTSQHKISASMIQDGVNKKSKFSELDDQMTAKLIDKQIFSFDTRDEELYKQLDQVKNKKEFKHFRKSKFFQKTQNKSKSGY